MVEVILGEKTGDKAIAVALDYAAAIRKTPIVVNDTRGFYVNRCVFRYMNESYDMLIEGVPPAMIENAAAWPACGRPARAQRRGGDRSLLQDLQGLDCRSRSAIGQARAHGAGHQARRRVGRLGRKNGKGFYDYRRSPQEVALAGLKTLYPQKAAEDVDVGMLQKRFLTTIALEAARTVEEGIVTIRARPMSARS